MKIKKLKSLLIIVCYFFIGSLWSPSQCMQHEEFLTLDVDLGISNYLQHQIQITNDHHDPLYDHHRDHPTGYRLDCTIGLSAHKERKDSINYDYYHIRQSVQINPNLINLDLQNGECTPLLVLGYTISIVPVLDNLDHADGAGVKILAYTPHSAQSKQEVTTGLDIGLNMELNVNNAGAGGNAGINITKHHSTMTVMDDLEITYTGVHAKARWDYKINANVNHICPLSWGGFNETQDIIWSINRAVCKNNNPNYAPGNQLTFRSTIDRIDFMKVHRRNPDAPWKQDEYKASKFSVVPNMYYDSVGLFI